MSTTRRLLGLLALVSSLGSVACGASNMGSTPLVPQGPGRAHKYVVVSTACWLGGLWGDALGEAPERRAGDDRARCEDALRITYGPDFTQPQVEVFRAVESSAVSDFVSRVSALADGDATDGPRSDNLGKLAKAVASAQRELLVARRAAHRVRRDTEREDRLTTTESQAAPALAAASELEALYKLDAGDLSPEARAIALLSVVDRVGFLRGVVRHLKVIALTAPVRLLFQVDPPTLPQDPAEPLVHAELLTYMTSVAKAAGHPVPDAATTPEDKYALAYGGFLAGLADKLTAEVQKMPASELQTVARAAADRLSQQAQRDVAAHTH